MFISLNFHATRVGEGEVETLKKKILKELKERKEKTYYHTLLP